MEAECRIGGISLRITGSSNLATSLLNLIIFMIMQWGLFHKGHHELVVFLGRPNTKKTKLVTKI